MPGELSCRIRARSDVEQARRDARAFARELGFGRDDVEMVALTVSELSMNLLRYADEGELQIRCVEGPRGTGIEIESRDQGPGIHDISRAMQEGYSTGGGLGSGLPGVRRMMDDFEIRSGAGGTTIVARKWLTTRSS